MTKHVRSIGCLLVSLLFVASIYALGFVVARVGMGDTNTQTSVAESPVGKWRQNDADQLVIIDLRPNGTGFITRDNESRYFEWRLAGKEFSIHQFSRPNGIASWVARTLRSSGLSDTATTKFKLVEVTSTKLTLAKDYAPDPSSGLGSGSERGELLHYEAVND